ncbi:zinc transporter ZIP8 [Paramuricea clavata]|uniref:Zinc transporter ZIP8 n=1 Tax=Paramuricea clavata TaxID=317549 RepID=A0A7D9D8S8_PARCT|nr:zinc transporter ZIP8 [Paramuricea clavata]
MSAWLCGWRFFLFVSLIVTANTATVPVEKLLKKFGTNDTLDAAQTTKLFESMGISNWNYNGSKEESCSSSAYFQRTYSNNGGTVNKTGLANLCPAVLYELSKDACQRQPKQEEEEGAEKEDVRRAWGFGFLFVTVISLLSLLGAILVPFMQKKIFQTVLMAMVSLAVGVLSGGGIFHLIPHALKLGTKDLSHMWKLVMVAVGIYMFFLLECTMKMYLHLKTLNSADSNTNETKVNPHANDGHGHSHYMFEAPETFPEIADEKKPNNLDLTTPGPEKKKIATVAWMIIIGDGLHNFVDGIAIGVSCSTSVLSGLSTSLAICCEELPHELVQDNKITDSGVVELGISDVDHHLVYLCRKVSIPKETPKIIFSRQFKNFNVNQFKEDLRNNINTNIITDDPNILWHD